MHTPRQFRRLLFSLVPVFFAVGLSSCKQRGFNHTTSGTKSKLQVSALCQQGLRLADYTGQTGQFCYTSDSVEGDTLKGLNANIRLHPWVPCNQIEFVSMAANRFKSELSGESFYFDFEKSMQYLTKRKFPMRELAQRIFNNPEKMPDEFTDHPVLRAPLHLALEKALNTATHRVFFNSMLFGGAWGLEVVRQMLVKAEEANRAGRDFQILILRDNYNKFNFQNEVDALWSELIEQSKNGRFKKNLVVLNADIEHRRQSAIPFGIHNIGAAVQSIVDTDVPLTGTSDHSKILVVDPYTENAKMIVMSKNVSDFNHMRYDEGALVTGPAASVSMHYYVKDIILAFKKFAKDNPDGTAKQRQVENWITADNQATSSTSGLRFKGAGDTDVRIAQNDVDDRVRNVEHNVLKLITMAKKNVRIHNYLAYHPMVAKAIADASKRLAPGQVRVIVDSSKLTSFNLNTLFPVMLKRELLVDTNSPNKQLEAIDVERVNIDSIVRWRKLLTPVLQKNQGYINATQQHHVKTIIIDDEYVLLGSANFDYNTLKGAFREFSVVIRDPKTGALAAEVFDAVWEPKNNQTVTTAEMEAQDKGLLSVRDRMTINRLISLEVARTEGMNPRNIDGKTLRAEGTSTQCY